ncbi:UNVERIFIED_CONTAM: hypothetical protein GTU68_023048 [Idotea baltica]|nr:hypothetical protein [Idotea baltica]
MAIVSD